MRPDSEELATAVPEDESKATLVLPDGKKARRQRRRHRRSSNQGAIAMSDASTRSGSPSSSQGMSEVALSRRSSGDAGDSSTHPIGNFTDDTLPQTAPPLGSPGTPARKPSPLSPAAIGDASQRHPISNATPVSSPSKMQAFTASCGTKLLLPTVGLFRGGEPFQSSPAGTPAATPMGRYTVFASSPPSPSKRLQGAMPAGDASQRTPLMSPMAGQSTALTSWLCGSPCGRLPSGPELAKLLHAALPEAYDD